MIIIGEKINGSIPPVAEAIAKQDAEFIKARAIAQENARATFIDCCASVPEAQEVEILHWMIDCIQGVTGPAHFRGRPQRRCAGGGVQVLQEAGPVQLCLRCRR